MPAASGLAECFGGDSVLNLQDMADDTRVGTEVGGSGQSKDASTRTFLIADVRGYTQMTEGLSAAQVPEAMNRFYEASSRALSGTEALLGQIEGDLVMGVFVPGLAGRHFRRKAVEGASRCRTACDLAQPECLCCRP